MAKKAGFVAELGVAEVHRAVNFYSRVLGCQLVDSLADEHGVPYWAEVSFAESRLMFERADLLSGELAGVARESGKPRFALVLRVEPAYTARAILERLRALQHAIDTGPTETAYGSFEFSFRDPDEYVVVVAGWG